MTTAHLKTLATSLGKLLGVLGLVFVLYKLYTEYSFANFQDNLTTLLPLIPMLLILNFTSSLLGIKAWQNLLGETAQKTVPFSLAYYYFAKTEIAKYIPGNIFHMVNRQMIASKLSLTQKQMGHIQFLLFFILIIGTVMTSFFFVLGSFSVPLWQLTILALATLALLIILLLTYKKISFKSKSINLLYLSIGISLQGVLLSLILQSQSEQISISLFFLTSAIYVLSWLIGFVTPGASGGLGVREASFLGLATFTALPIAESALLFGVLLARLINIIVDIILYLSTYVLKDGNE